MKFAIAVLFGLVMMSDAKSTQDVFAEIDTELSLDETVLSEQTHAIAETEVNKLADEVASWGKQVGSIHHETALLKKKNWEALMQKAQGWK